MIPEYKTILSGPRDRYLQGQAYSKWNYLLAPGTILHLDRIAKAIVFRCSLIERLNLLSFANSISRSIIAEGLLPKFGTAISVKPDF